MSKDQIARFNTILSLNNAFAHQTSFLDKESLQMLLDCAWFTATAGALDAFIIAMSHESAYTGLNFSWFRERYTNFVYVDRIVVAPHARRMGHARKFYGDLIVKARKHGIDHICCEINHQPPNPDSVAFHRKLGFELIGTALSVGQKTVGYWIRTL